MERKEHIKFKKEEERKAKRKKGEEKSEKRETPYLPPLFIWMSSTEPSQLPPTTISLSPQTSSTSIEGISTPNNERIVLRVYNESNSNQYKTIVATATTTVGELKCRYLVKHDIPIKSTDLYAIWAFLEDDAGTQLNDSDVIFDCFSRLNATSASKVIIRCLKKDQGSQEAANSSKLRPLPSSIETLGNSKSKSGAQDVIDNEDCVYNAGNMEIDVNFAGFTSPMPPSSFVVNMWATAEDVVKILLDKLGIQENDLGMYGLYTITLESSLETLIPNEELLLGINYGDKFIFKKKN